MNPNCVERRDSTVATQALHLMNNGMIHELAEHFAKRVSQEAGADPAKQVERAYLLGLSRLPTKEENRAGVAALHRLSEEWAKSLPTQHEALELKALTTFCHALVNSAGFLYVD
jgi:hypothetical protein